MQLRPVTFKYKEEYTNRARQQEYGLIAEEVAAVFPDLVRYGDGEEPEGVRYQLLNVLLLNEVQKQQRKNERQQEEIADLSARLARLESQAGQQACR